MSAPWAGGGAAAGAATKGPVRSASETRARPARRAAGVGPGAVRAGRTPRVEPTRVGQEVDTAHELHREEHVVGIGHHELVELHEVRVRDIRESPELLLEAVERRRAESEQRLDGDRLAAVAVERLVDHPHAARRRCAPRTS